MKVELKGNDTKNSKPYPKLMKSTHSNRVWLMTKDEVGTILFVSDNDTYDMGERSNGLNMDVLEDYEGSICLSND